MHKKRIYRTLSVVISLSLVLSICSVVGADTDDTSAEAVTEESVDVTADTTTDTQDTAPTTDTTTDTSTDTTTDTSTDTTTDTSTDTTTDTSTDTTTDTTTDDTSTDTSDETDVTTDLSAETDTSTDLSADSDSTDPSTEEEASENTDSEEESDSEETADTTDTETSDEASDTDDTAADSSSDSSSEDSSDDSSDSDANEIVTSPYSSNEELIASTDIVIPPTITSNFRFTTVEKVYAICNIEQMNIYEEDSEDATIVGTLSQDGLCYVLKEDGESDWVFIESGVVRGFVLATDLITDDEAEAFVSEVGEENLLVAEALVEPTENAALTYTKTTVRETVVEKVYALAAESSVDILEDMTDDARVIGTLSENGLCFILADNLDDGWVYVESDDVRGFVQSDQLLDSDESEAQVAESGGWTEDQESAYEAAEEAYNDAKQALDENDADSETTEEVTTELNTVYAEAEETLEALEEEKTEVLEAGEESYTLAEEEIEPSDNAACYYTLTSVKEASVASAIGTAMVEYAQQFLGNPYVWGGTSLTNGTDCSGFVQSIYAAFGYSIPRTSREQATYGTQIPVDEAQPGDLIFYANNGTVYHVVMYMGNGQVIHASSSTTGIITSSINYSNAVWACRIIEDTDEDVIETVNAAAYESTTSYTLAQEDDYGELLGTFKLTAYCNCSICNGQWAGGATASGTTPTQGRTIAMAGLPFGTKLIINGKIYTVEDRGTDYGHVDIYMNDHDEANAFGVQYAQVYLAN